MKKVFFTVLTVLSLIFTTAQSTKFGVKAGIGMAKFSGDSRLKSKVGFQVGGFAEIKVSDKIAIQPELLYSAVGSNYKNSELEDNYSSKSDNDINLGYIVLPVMIKFYAANKISLEIGPQIGFLASAKLKDNFTETYGGNTYVSNGVTDIKDRLNSTDFSFNLGGSYDINEKISFGLRYTNGLTRIQKELSEEQTAANNSLIQLNFSYKF